MSVTKDNIISQNISVLLTSKETGFDPNQFIFSMLVQYITEAANILPLL